MNGENKVERPTVTNILEEVKEAICDDYCRYPKESEDTLKEDQDLFFDIYCNTCPLNRL